MRKLIFVLCLLSLFILIGCQTDKPDPPKEDNFSISLSENNIEVYVTQLYEIEYTITNNDNIVSLAVVIESDDDNINVNNKFITALEPGTAEVKISLQDFPEVSTTLKITIKDALELSSEDGNYIVYVGDTLTLNALDRSDKEGLGVSWKSSNILLASVNNGIVTGIREGTVTIEVQSKTNNKIKTVEVTVKMASIESIEIDGVDNITLGTEVVLTTTILPQNADQRITWTTSDPSIATVSATGRVTTLKSGEVTITATSVYDETKKATLTITITADPIALLESFHVEKPFRRNVSTYGYNPSIRYQWVYGSVNMYFNADMNLIENIIPIDENEYTGKVATPSMLVAAEPMKLVRSGILHPETNYIVYHDTGNHTPGANAQMHAQYMVGSHNRGNRARSWHYSVDENNVIYHIPENEVTWQGDTFDAYAKSIGIETCVDFGSDLYTTWQRTAKLIADIMNRQGLDFDAIKQHYDFSGKECPQALRRNNLYNHAIDLVRAEYYVLTELRDYTVSFTSLNPELVDDRGRVINHPQTATRVGYIVNITNDDGYNESTVLYSIIPGTDGTTDVDLDFNPDDLEIAKAFDLEVGLLPQTVTLDDEQQINNLRDQYSDLTTEQKNLVISLNYFEKIEFSLLQLYRVDTPIIINQILASNNSVTEFGFIELYNSTNQDISLAGWTLQYAPANSSFTFENNEAGINTYFFGENDVIKANGYFLIQAQAGNHDGGLYLPIPNAIFDVYIEDNGKFAITNSQLVVDKVDDDHVVDFVGYGTATLYEGDGTAFALTDDQALIRKQMIDTNNNRLDFTSRYPNPRNADLQTFIETLTTEQLNAREVDLMILQLPTQITANEEQLINNTRSAFNNLTSFEKSLVTLFDILTLKEMELYQIINPNLYQIYLATQSMPDQIYFDYQLPDSVTWSYKDGEDESYFDIETGTYLKLSIEPQLTTLVATLNGESLDIVINFGVVRPGQQTILSNGTSAPSAGGNTDGGGGSVAEQLASIGFGGFAIVVGNNIYFTGESTFIPLTDANGTDLTVSQLRPFGSVAPTYNQGLIKGTARAYTGTGALYYNASDVDLTLNPSDTYGRNNHASHGYGKVVFSPNQDGTYTVLQHWADSGDNEVRGTHTQTLKPGEYLWCPHIFETNATYGTALMQPNSSTGGRGALVKDTIIEILEFKTFS